jgi:hypothetical protein
VWSWTPVNQVAQVSIAGRVLPMHVSQAVFSQSNLLAVLARSTTSAGEVISPLDIPQLVTLVTRSRDKAYQPLSAAFTKTVAQLSASARAVTPAPAVISPLDVGATFTITVQAADRPMPLTGVWAYQAAQLSTQRRAMPAASSQVLLAKQVLLAARRRDTDPPFTQAQLGKEALLVAQQRDTSTPRSPLAAKKVVTQSAVARDTALHESYRILASEVLLAAQQRITPPPDSMVGVMAISIRQQAVQGRAAPPAGAMRSPMYSKAVRITYAMGREMPHPDDVLDPSVGRHSGQVATLTTQHRVTEPPTDTGDSGPDARLHGLALVPVLLDTDFPEPPTEPTDLALARMNALAQVAVLPDSSFPPQSRVYLPALAESAAIGDAEGWQDPTVPVSPALLHGMGEVLVLGDASLPPADLPLSDARLSLIGRQVALDDSTGWRDPTMPQSDARVRQVIEFAVLSETGLPPGDQPQSVVSTGQVAQVAVLADKVIAGTLAGSNAVTLLLLEQAVLSDPTMRRLPARPAGPRPIISISIT